MIYGFIGLGNMAGAILRGMAGSGSFASDTLRHPAQNRARHITKTNESIDHRIYLRCLAEFRTFRCEIKWKFILSGGSADRKNSYRLASVEFCPHGTKLCAQSRRDFRETAQPFP